MRARARVVAERGPGGATRLSVLRSESPLLLRRTGPPGGDGRAAEVHLVGGAAGPLGGDDLRLSVEVGPGARLCLRTAAAALALPGASGAASGMAVEVTVAAGGHLDWLPEPLIAGRGCRHRATARVRLAAGASLCWREELICGRHGEQPGDASTRLTVSYDDLPLYDQELAVGPDAPGWAGPAVLAGARATGSLLRVDPAWLTGAPPPEHHGPEAVTMPLAGPAVVTTAVGADAARLRRRLDAQCPYSGGVKHSATLA
ncbi:urease accessory protein UreD [Natronosporangium hydrolyticum]|uniref:Urease accessory protein UreD n=1 Tax=Natronosporangium hydrolyticum TaxID=2811111 RepID=A0A895YD62_9ACTN|nr:urease accessory protein UreD [Natronosporangium hydrolyticum]QSB13309.1 urease accessory protein UreD [Natronosporangium hydrolyticum]